MATYRDGVKRKGDKIGMENNSHIVFMCIIMRWSRNRSASWQRGFGPPHYYAHTNYVTIILHPNLVSFPFYTIPICGHSQSARFFIYLLNMQMFGFILAKHMQVAIIGLVLSEKVIYVLDIHHTQSLLRNMNHT